MASKTPSLSSVSAEGLDKSINKNFVDLDEGAKLTIPKYKKYNKKQSKDDVKLMEFIQKYKLEKLSRILLNEGITIDFLMSQNENEINSISRELTNKIIQQNKFKFAVQEIKTKNNLQSISNTKYDDDKKEDDIINSINNKIAIDKKIEKKKGKFGNNKTIITWYYNGSDHIKHEIILKHHDKMDKNMKSKRVIIVDGKERYSKKSNDANFVIKECADHLKLEIINNHNNVLFELYINGISFDDLLLNPKKPSFSL